MFENGQAVVTPLGVTVFGSCVLRVAADVAVVSCTVSRLEQKPAIAFAAARAGAQSVQSRLRALNVEAGTSRITLSQQTRYVNGENRFVGYLASVAIRVLIPELERVELVVCSLVEAGANEIQSVSFETRQLKQVRADARRQAVAAAREKAENYCLAAGVVLGPVLHIEDVNPEAVRGRSEGHRGGGDLDLELDEAGQGNAFDPGAIAVTAAVVVAYGLRNDC